MENGQTKDELRRLEKRVSELETANTALRDDSGAQEQYSRRNCLLVHGIPEDQTDTSDAVLWLCNSQLGLDLDRSQIDRSHRLGYRSETPSPSVEPSYFAGPASSTWTINGRIVCLLANGRKETVQTDSDLASVRQHCRH